MGKLTSSNLWLIHIILPIILCFLMICFDGTSAANISTDEAALLALKAHITNDPQNLIASNWSKATSVCSWMGITCGTRHRRVRAIVLEAMSLTGTIPPQIGNLSFLVNFSLNGGFPISLCNLSKLYHLNLGMNNLEGPIPDAIGNLQNLKLLSLENNDLSGGIPIGIFNISSLQDVRFNNNWLSGSIPTTVLLKNMSSLRILTFATNNLTGQLPSNMFIRLPALEVLGFGANSFTGPIPSTLFGCKRIQSLGLSFNHFEGDLHSFGNLTMLRELYLGYNNFKGEIPNSIGNLVYLELFSLIRNSISGRIPSFIGNLTQLWSLDLGENRMTGSIPFEIGNLAYLEEFYLGVNNLDGTFPSNFYNISTLKVLDLDDNNLSGSLPPCFGLQLPNLEYILIGVNSFYGHIPVSLFNASKLIMLDLDSNMFSGSIPDDALGNLINLQVLHLQDNQLTSQSLFTFFSSLANCRNLTFLELSQNPLNATLPISIGNLSSSLEYIYIDRSGLEEIEELRKLRKLQALQLHVNRIQGSIPSELCSLKSLDVMDFAENELSGKIPSCIGNLNSLRKVYLQSNRFNSTLPSTLWSLKDILALNLSSNSLKGSLSLDIGNLKAVTLLDLSGNQLSGSIPPTFGGLQSLTYLSLSKNNLEGSIPEALSDALSLEFLDLSINNLSGEIPKSLEKLEYLKDFNVSFNDLQGEIPNGGKFMNLSAQSFLRNKALCGDPKFKVHPCKTSHQNQTKKAKIILVVIGTTVLTLGTLIVVMIWYCRRKTRLPTHQQHFLALPTWERISIHELKQATNNFDEMNLLGRGSFGSVYKGTLSNGMPIAVKVYSLDSEGAFKSFDVECEVLRRIRHRNLVKIITSSCTTELKALVMEFMPNWSLEKWLYSHNYFLDILQRLNIMIDVASALEYLHHGSIEPIVHCDLKPENVLLDEDMVAHLADFGISKLIGEDQSFIQTMTLATVGYMAPEYGSEGLVSIKGDIYSFGILMIETFTRRRPTDEMFDEEMSMKRWIQETLPSGVAPLVDSNLLSVNEQHYFARTDCISSIMNLALECCAEVPEERISSKDVVSALNKIKVKLLNDVQHV